MADTKISALTDGAPAVSTDIIPVARSGANRRVTVGDVVSAVNTLAAVQAMSAGQILSLNAETASPQILACPSAIYELTGGSTGVKTTLLEVAIPDNALNSATSRIYIELGFWYTRNTNIKAMGVDIGTTAGTAVNIYSRTRSSATHGADNGVLVVRKHSDGSDRMMCTVGDLTGATFSGSNFNTTEPRGTIAVSPTSSGLKVFFWGRLDTANTDYVRLYECMVRLDKSA